MSGPRVSDLLDLVQRDLDLQQRAYARNFPAQTRRLRERFGSLPAAELQYTEIEEYKADRLAQGAARATVNHELGALNRAYVLGMDAEIIDRRPKIRWLKVDNARQGFVTIAQMERLVTHLPPAIGDYAEFAYWSGWRRREIRELTWDSVGEDGFVHCTPPRSKTRRAKKVARSGPIDRVITRRERARVFSSPLVFHRGRGKPIKDFREAWAQARGMAGLPGLLFHDLRRSFVRNALRAGIRERTVMEISGHLTRAVFDRYNIVDEADLVDATLKLDAFRQESSSS